MYSSFFLFDDLVPRDILAQWDQNFSEVYMQQIHKLVVAFFFKYFKSRILAIAGGSPPLHPRRSAGGQPIGQEIMQNQWGQFCENQLSIEKLNKIFF